MQISIVYLVGLTAMMLLSGSCGWVACSLIRVAAYRERLHAESKRVRHALAGLSRLAETVASDVRSHKRSLNDVSGELDRVEVQEVQVVASIVTRLAEANKDMEQRLATAESRLREQQRELEARSAEAATDELTGLANRRSFNDELARRFSEYKRTQRPLSVIFVDVDHFKDLNDREGHQAGDEVLRSISTTLRQTVRGMDLVARYGGEEFSIVMPNTPMVAAVAVAERAREAIARREMRYEGKVFKITVSTGVAEIRSSEHVPLLLRRADEAMYTSKSVGRNCTHYHDGRKSVPARKPSLTADHEELVSRATPSTGGQGNDALQTNTTQAPMTESPPEQPVCDGEQRMGDLVCSRSAYCHTLRSRLAEWKRGGSSFTIALVSIDQSTELTQRFSTHEQSYLIPRVGLLVANLLREMDLVGDYDEGCFALILPRTQTSDAIIVAERLLKAAAEQPLVTKSDSLSITLSIGMAEVTDGDDVIRFLHRADEALDAAAQAGGNRCYSHNGSWPEPIIEPAEVVTS
jgi:diguanylate cyclase